MDLPILIFISLFISGSFSTTIVYNKAISSDILSKSFYNEIKKIDDLSDSPVVNDPLPYDPEKCLLSLRQIVNSFPSIKVLPFFDSWGKFPSGILLGNFHDMGNFDECVRTSVELTKETGMINGQYCFANIPLNKTNELDTNRYHLPRVLPAAPSDILANSTAFIANIGICVPDSCGPEFVSTLFNKSLSTVFEKGGAYITHCTNGKPPPYTATIVSGICVFSLFGILMLLSSLYDFFTGYFGKQPVQILLAFSVLTNGKKLFVINTKKSPNNIDCLTGIRVFSMIWIVYGHTYLIAETFPTINKLDVKDWFKTLISLHVVQATLAVDSFFFISGVLVAWSGLRELDRTKGKLNVVMMYVHRYLRLTPLLGITILFIFSINKIIGSGPLRQWIIDSEDCHGDNWWQNLLYLQNYFNVKDKGCFVRGWYLAVDFQLYVLSPLLLIPIWKWGKKFAPVVLALAMGSSLCVMIIYMVNKNTSMRGDNEYEWFRVYSPTHTRCSPWLIGFGLGYFMHVNNRKTFRIPRLYIFFGWVASLLVMAAIIFGTYFRIRIEDKGTIFESAMFEGWRHFSWSIALSWVTFACHFGFGGFINTFLSHPFFQPLGRLTYALYLWHPLLITINFGNIRTPLYFSTYQQLVNFWSSFGMSVMVAILASLAFESPILIIEKFIFGGGKKGNPPVSGPTPQLVLEVSKNS